MKIIYLFIFLLFVITTIKITNNNKITNKIIEIRILKHLKTNKEREKGLMFIKK